MAKTLTAAILLGCTLLGCSESKMDMAEMMQKPEPAPQMDMLKPLLGAWSGTAEIIEPTPEQMAAEMPEGSEPPPNTFQGGSTWEMALDDMYIKSEGWYEMGDGQQVQMVEFITWDEKAKKFHSWYFSSRGEHGEGWHTPMESGKKFSMTSKGTDGMGNATTGSGTWTLPDENTMDWTWNENGPMGKMKMKGTSTRTAG